MKNTDKPETAVSQDYNSPDKHFLAGIIGWFANNSVAANLLLVMTMVLGLMSVNSQRKEAFPSIEPNMITVAVTYDSGDAVQAEEGIALKIEEALETVAGIKRITSVSNGSGSTVHIEKKPIMNSRHYSLM